SAKGCACTPAANKPVRASSSVVGLAGNTRRWQGIGRSPLTDVVMGCKFPLIPPAEECSRYVLMVSTRGSTAVQCTLWPNPDIIQRRRWRQHFMPLLSKQGYSIRLMEAT